MTSDVQNNYRKIMSIHIFNHHIRTPLLLLALAEILVLYSSVWIGISVCDWLDLGTDISLGVSSNQVAVSYTATLFLSLFAFSLYQLNQRVSFEHVLARLIVAFFVGLTILAALNSIAIAAKYSVLRIAIITTIAFPSIILVRRFFYRTVDENVFRSNVLIYGAGKQALSVAALRRRSDRRGFKVCGYISADPANIRVTKYEPGAKIFDRGCTLLEHARNVRADEIVVALDDRRGILPIDELLECKVNGIEIVNLPMFLERETGKIHIDVLSRASMLIFSHGFSVGYVRKIIKRAVDIVGAVAGLLITAPIMLAAALAIFIESRFRGPVLFHQVRTGLHGRPFTLHKLRSMSVDAEADGRPRWATENDSRVTRVGRFLRKTRIDELPQLFNVLVGQMSFVGPRPERPEFVEELSKEIPYYQARHTVLPGITGWAQMKYPYGATVKESAEKLEYDLYYAKNCNLVFDIAIILQTIEVVFFGKGAR